MALGEILRAILAVLTLGAGLATSLTPLAQAQRSPLLAAVVAPPPPLQPQCCRCLDDDVAPLQLNSGSGPGTVQWRVSGPGVAAGATAFAITRNLNGYWSARLSRAGWIQPGTSNGDQYHPDGTYIYEVTFTSPQFCTIPMRFLLEGSAAGDEEVKVYVDDFTLPIGQTPLGPISQRDSGIGVAIDAGIRGWGFTKERMIVYFGKLLGPGAHTLRLEVKNYKRTPHGLLVQAQVRTICPGLGST